jgi:hypothetical protein
MAGVGVSVSAVLTKKGFSDNASTCFIVTSGRLTSPAAPKQNCKTPQLAMIERVPKIRKQPSDFPNK